MWLNARQKYNSPAKKGLEEFIDINSENSLTWRLTFLFSTCGRQLPLSKTMTTVTPQLYNANGGKKLWEVTVNYKRLKSIKNKLNV